MSQLKKQLAEILSVRNCIVGVIALVGIYLTVAPFTPEIGYRLQHSLIGRFLPQPAAKVATNTDHLLEIPSIGLQENVLEGTSDKTLFKGLWHRPATGTPDKGSNMVITGHRFMYGNPHTFYLLDKVKKGDVAIVYWKGKRYEYTVTETKTVSPTDVSVEANTDQPILTLYTCTPLGTSKYRIVVRAALKTTVAVR